MATGRLGAADLAATTNTTLYTVPAGKAASFSVSFCNRNATPVTVRLALASAATPTNAEWVLYEALIEGNGALERTGLVLDAGKLAVVQSSAANVSAVAYGFEE